MCGRERQLFEAASHSMLVNDILMNQDGAWCPSSAECRVCMDVLDTMTDELEGLEWERIIKKARIDKDQAPKCAEHDQCAGSVVPIMIEDELDTEEWSKGDEDVCKTIWTEYDCKLLPPLWPLWTPTPQKVYDELLDEVWQDLGDVNNKRIPTIPVSPTVTMEHLAQERGMPTRVWCLLMSLRLPLAFYNIFLFIFNGDVSGPPFLDMCDFYSGVGRIAEVFSQSGYVSQRFEFLHHELNFNVCTSEGFCATVGMLMSLKVDSDTSGPDGALHTVLYLCRAPLGA